MIIKAKSAASFRSKAPITIKNRDILDLPATEHAAAAKTYICPICHIQVGRKALCAHARKEHQVDRPSAFPFEPEHDQLPGELACKHCYSVFTMDFALQTHFRRACCPVLFCRWLSSQYFGSIDSLIESCHQVPDARISMRSDSIAIPCGLMPFEAFPRTDECQLHGLLWTPNLLIIQCLRKTLSFAPEHHVRWYVTSIRWSAHVCELPHTCLTADQVFQFLADLEHFVPVHWAWTSNKFSFPARTGYVVYEIE